MTTAVIGGVKEKITEEAGADVGGMTSITVEAVMKKKNQQNALPNAGGERMTTIKKNLQPVVVDAIKNEKKRTLTKQRPVHCA